MGIMSSTNEEVGSRLKFLREKMGLSQGSFARSLGLSLRGYQNYERGERSASKELICALMDRYNIDPRWLLTGEENKLDLVREGRAAYTSIDEVNQIKAWLDEFWTKASEKERAWLTIQMQHVFPQYRNWLRKNGE